MTWFLQACYEELSLKCVGCRKSSVKVCARQFVDRCEGHGSILEIVTPDSAPVKPLKGVSVGGDVGIRDFARYALP